MAGRIFSKPRVSNSYADFPPFYQKWLDNQIVLPQKEQNKLLRKYEETGNIDYLHAFFAQFIKLAVKLSKKYRNRGLDEDDLIQECFFAFYKTYRKWDPTKGSFTTYLTAWIKGSLQKAIFEKGDLIRSPAHIHAGLSKIFFAEIRLSLKGIKEPTPAEIAKETNMTEKQVEKTLRHRAKLPVSLEEKRRRSNDPYDEDQTLGDSLCDSAFSNDPEIQMITKQEILNRCHRIKTIIQKLDRLIKNQVTAKRQATFERQVIIFKMRYGLDDGFFKKKTLENIASLYGVSRERIRQIVKRIQLRLNLVIIDPETDSQIDTLVEDIRVLKELCKLVNGDNVFARATRFILDNDQIIPPKR